MKNFKRAMALTLAVIMLFCTATAGALYKGNAAYDSFVNSIYSGLSQKKGEFSTIYTAGALNENILRAAFERAASLSFDNMRMVTGYSSSYMGLSATFKVQYGKDNGLPTAFASNYDEAFVIINRVISSHDRGVNIYIEDQDHTSDIAAMQKKALDLYTKAVEEGSHPYYSYILSGVAYSVSRVMGRSAGYFFSYEFSYNETPIQTGIVDDFVSKALDSLDLSNKTVPQKAEAINNYVKQHVSYKLTGGRDDLTAFGAIKNGTAVCQGYALLTQAMLEGAGVPARIVTGTGTDPNTKKTESHMWNAVRVDGRWLHLDVTWNDAFADDNPYLLLTDDEIKTDHSYDASVFNMRAFAGGHQRYLAKAQGEIILTVGSPNMRAGNRSVEIDPGRGTVPAIYSGRTLLPVRAIIENVGGSIAWTASTRQVTINYRDYIIDLFIDSKIANVNGMEIILDVPPRLENDRTMVPVRFVAEMMGMGVDWNEGQSRVTIRPY